jgi:hypothetical protein
LLSGDCAPVVQAASTLDAAASEKWRRRSENDDGAVDDVSESDDKAVESSDFGLGFKQFLQAACAQA